MTSSVARAWKTTEKVDPPGPSLRERLLEQVVDRRSVLYRDCLCVAVMRDADAAAMARGGGWVMCPKRESVNDEGQALSPDRSRDTHPVRSSCLRGPSRRAARAIVGAAKMLTTRLCTLLHATPPPRCIHPIASSASSPVTFVNPLEVDGFAEPGGWGFHADPKSLPLLIFLPGMDGSLATPFMQYAELSTTFELACMRHVQGLKSRASFAELTTACADEILSITQDGQRQALLVGESFGATLALAVANELQERPTTADSVRGLVLVNPATSYRRSALATVGPLCSRLSGIALSPLYVLSLVALAAFVLTPAYQAPSFLSTIAAKKATELNNNPHREAFVGRVAMGDLSRTAERSAGHWAVACVGYLYSKRSGLPAKGVARTRRRSCERAQHCRIAQAASPCCCG